jgi:uracil-DNA glycosylase
MTIARSRSGVRGGSLPGVNETSDAAIGFSTSLVEEIRTCAICKERFEATATSHAPRPVVWFRSGLRILVTGQAPGRRVHEAGRPFFDRSGDRLREWMGVDATTFYDRNRIGVLPTAFCWPGYDARGADLPPPPVCWERWHNQALAEIGPVRLRLIVGGHAIRRHLGVRGSVTEIVAAWRDYAPAVFPLPHPSWRNNAWLRDNPWFDRELVPELRQVVAKVLRD